MSQSLKKKRISAYKAQNGCCYYCGFPMWLDDPDEIGHESQISRRALHKIRCTAEHLHPRADGGSDSRSNIVAACLHCNRTRHRRKRPPEPPRYREIVQGRIRANSWHDSQIRELVKV